MTVLVRQAYLDALAAAAPALRVPSWKRKESRCG